MAACVRIRSLARVTSRALSTAGGRQQKALAEEATDHEEARKTFTDLQKERQEQAEHTVLISCPPNINENKFLKYLSQYGNVASHFFYESYGTHAVVEFLEKESVESLRAATNVPRADDECIVPFKSRLFVFKSERAMDRVPVHCLKQAAVPVNELIQKLCKAENVNEQAQALMEEYQLTDENIRLRFLVSSLIRDVAAAYFPEATVNPYGSTVNSFGKLGCDLDLFLDLDTIGKSGTGKSAGPFTSEYLMKRVPSGRVMTQRILSVIGECVDNFGPGCTGVQKILNARCPLVRFTHQPAGLQCDLTADNRIALRSSELLYLYGHCDHRVRPLVFTLRCWARVHGVTSAIPGAWITNFSLTTMILFFLQKRRPPIIPTLDQLKNLSGKEDKHIVDGHDCTFVSNLNKIKPSENSESVDLLLSEFFEFYGNFDFTKNCINIRKGKEQNKPDSSPLYIQNPFEQTLNVSKNVNQTQLERFVAITRESAWILQEQLNRPSERDNHPWGLAAVLLPSLSQGIGKAKRKRKKGMASDRVKSLLESLKTDGKAR
ncbi:poly(A) RNA polymerase, mitochondrial [Spea bombifrons]|uniref:poly(A) RNA polymerase, mitochondrial n=1 Tax=Spea bombifrons TaxID=233779 RepID=UPI00234B2505|nr:poly(A) RNA polymerase, mitochondrial [Spea bombifrons]